MSEEKPHFKVTDRRLFNPDGSPRDIVRETETTPESPVRETATATPASSAASASPFSGDADREETAPTARTEPATEARSSASAARGADVEADGAQSDPTAFANLVMFVAQPAAAAMGMTEYPGMGQPEIDLPLAKHCIDLLATIQHKTRANLSTQETQILEGLLAELRMQYVSLTNARPAAASPRGFTGNDITGGR